MTDSSLFISTSHRQSVLLHDCIVSVARARYPISAAKNSMTSFAKNRLALTISVFVILTLLTDTVTQTVSTSDSLEVKLSCARARVLRVTKHRTLLHHIFQTSFKAGTNIFRSNSVTVLSIYCSLCNCGRLR